MKSLKDRGSNSDCRALYRNDYFHPGISPLPGTGAGTGDFPDQRRIPHQRGRLCEEEEENSAQLDASDTRSLDEVVRWLLGLQISFRFITYYREGRTAPAL